MDQKRVLIVDDEADIRELLELTLARMQLATEGAANLAAARRLLARERFDLCLTDMRLPDGDGLMLLADIQQQAPRLPVAVITAYGSTENAVAALKGGAFDYLSKPIDLAVLRNLVTSALRLDSTYPERDRRSRDVLIGESAPMQALRATILKLARSQAPVYISGESGTGKELVARLIHAKGPRAERPFVPVNCGAIPGELMESEFFGHRKGSFTGAHADKEGLFQAAQGGTLFLDEVADLPLPMQVKLLRAIQEKAVRPVGAAQETASDVRILSATHRDLGALTREGRFRQDLFYRLNVIEVHVPPLRERSEDIPALAQHCLARIAPANDAPVLSEAARDTLARHPFPGNVRELENILERACALCEGERIEAADLRLLDHTATGAEGDGDAGLPDYLDRLEKDAIEKALRETRYNKTAAAKLLGITFRALRYRLKKLGME
jgi:two-component system response regulator PilR (NtrC family)